MAEEAAAHHLLNVLEERDLTVDLDKVLAAFEDEHIGREATIWVREFLNEDTLLTQEELELYRALEKKGILHQYEENDGPIRPVLDHDISSAIDSLQNSTAAIEKQCKVLENQRDSLLALRALDKPNLAVEHLRNERRRRENQEKARLDLSVEDVVTSVGEQLTDTLRDIDSQKSSLKAYLTERLASDDKMLTALPGIVSRILAEVEPSEDEDSVEQWCNAIVSFRTAEIKARVDAVYLNSLTNDSPDNLPNAPGDEVRERKGALQSELEILHAEVAAVAEMAVEHELRKPMTDIQERRDSEKTQARAAWLKYVLLTLDFMSKRLDTLMSHTQSIHEFQQALFQIHAVASQRVLENTLIQPIPPSRLRALSASKSAFTPSIKLKPTNSLDLPPALQDALRHANVSFNQSSISALRDALVRTQLEREKTLIDHYVSASSATHCRLADRLAKADADARVILDALYTHTPFSKVRLADPEVEGEIQSFEGLMREREKELLDAEGRVLSLGNANVRSFVERYGVK